jgi:hypothetical protein
MDDEVKTMMCSCHSNTSERANCGSPFPWALQSNLLHIVHAHISYVCS